MKKLLFLLITFAAIFTLPWIGSIVRWDGYPPGYGEFPALMAVPDPGFNLPFFIFGCTVALGIVLFLAFPGWFGFKPAKPIPPRPSASYPSWFWWSLPVLGLSWLFMWGRFKGFEFIEHYTFVPLWWSFILVLDGIVYKRNGGVSLLSSKPKTLQLLAVVSCFSWYAFEYLNFFVMENWYYPNNTILTNFGNIFWFSMSYTTVLPAIVEWYLLLKTFSAFRDRYSDGPKLGATKPMLIAFYIVGLLLALGMGLFPFQLFWVLWVALVPLLSAAMMLLGYWTPFSSLKQGNWSPLILIAIATLFNGFFWEFWNFGSKWFHGTEPTNPNFWKYSVPYLDKIHIFSEMPILGYFGYLFFGVNCWILWLFAAKVFQFDDNFDVTDSSAK
ncbi:small-conductance mechanosensitive channel [Paenibacillus chartarius]|uniref:Small-conductance mechanosensitive channel n=1 Tax=Paenibacillus chartarius TaxID=747481 RepID=A0ABV6DM32_9BACL